MQIDDVAQTGKTARQKTEQTSIVQAGNSTTQIIVPICHLCHSLNTNKKTPPFSHWTKIKLLLGCVGNHYQNELVPRGTKTVLRSPAWIPREQLSLLTTIASYQPFQMCKCSRIMMTYVLLQEEQNEQLFLHSIPRQSTLTSPRRPSLPAPGLVMVVLVLSPYR